MAAHTRSGSPLEDALDMAVLAGQVAVETFELIAGCQVVELRPLDRPCLRRHEQQTQESNRDELYSPDHACCSLVGPRAFEAGRGVALLTFLSEASLVHIVTGMTRTADHRGFDYVLRSDMTIGTTDFRVSPQQREAGMGCVVKVPHLPAVRVVALRAVLPQTAVVNIVLGMATDTFFRRVIESLRRVALAAGYDHV